MQLFAGGDDNVLIAACEAKKQVNYRCLECHGCVRVRRGGIRQAHFYHLDHNRHCRQSGKGLVHLQVQTYLQRHLPPFEVDVEWRCPEIARIADVAWHAKKLVFEVQCASISAEEVKERNASYASIGYRVVWVLHDERYNSRRLSSAESALKDLPCYFTNIDEDGAGMIYDQLSHISQGERVYRLPKWPIAVELPVERKAGDDLFFKKMVPKRLLLRAKHWPVSFSGDAIDRFMQGMPLEEKTLEQFLSYEESDICCDGLDQPLSSAMMRLWHCLIARPYRSLLALVVERNSS